MTAAVSGSSGAPMEKSAALPVVVALDEPPEASEVLCRAADLARRLSTHLHVAHVRDLLAPNLLGVPAGLGGLPPPATHLAMDVEAAESDRVRESIAGELAGSGVDWTLHVGEGDPARIVAELADSVEAYCIVLGSRGEGFGAFLERLVRPSVTHALIRDQRRPVVVIPSDS